MLEIKCPYCDNMIKLSGLDIADHGTQIITCSISEHELDHNPENVKSGCFQQFVIKIIPRLPEIKVFSLHEKD